VPAQGLPFRVQFEKPSLMAPRHPVTAEVDTRRTPGPYLGFRAEHMHTTILGGSSVRMSQVALRRCGGRRLISGVGIRRTDLCGATRVSRFATATPVPHLPASLPSTPTSPSRDSQGI
jgi:hypothetical protein